jgi:hypothetical protein
LVFYNATDGSAVKLDGSFLSFLDKFSVSPEYLKLDYPILRIKKQLEITGVREYLGDILIKFSNEDIFRITYMSNREDNPQVLFIYEKTNVDEAELYSSALKCFDSGRDLGS